MATITSIEGTKANLSTTEWSLAANTAYAAEGAGGDSSSNAAGKYELILDATDMAVADVFTLKVYERLTSSSTQKAIMELSVAGTSNKPLVFPLPALKYAWDVTLVKVSGADADFTWSIRRPGA